MFFVGVHANGKVFVEVLIENTNSTDQTLVWTMKDGMGKILISENAEIPANGSYRNFTSNRVIELGTNQALTDFSIELN